MSSNAVFTFDLAEASDMSNQREEKQLFVQDGLLAKKFEWNF